jgi:hypothetical protein
MPSRLSSLCKLLIAYAAFQILTPTSFASAQGSQPTQRSEIKYQDFRSAPLSETEDLQRENLSPVVDSTYFANRLSRLLEPIVQTARYRSSSDLTKSMPLTFHIVVRSETNNVRGGEVGYTNIDRPEKTEYADLHMPGDFASFLNEIHYYNIPLVEAVKTEALAISKATGFSEVASPEKADLLITINLANRRLTSVQFPPAYVTKYPVRRAADLRSNAIAADPRSNTIHELLYLLPWTEIKLYYTFDSNTRATLIVGGEINIEYPVRTYWQEQAARHILSDLKLAQALGFGTSKAAVVDAFRSPSDTFLPNLLASVDAPEGYWYGERPLASLLILSRLAIPPVPGDALSELTHKFGRQSDCTSEDHATVLGGRLFRAMAMFKSGSRLGALFLDPETEDYREYLFNKASFMAQLSLVDYKKAFDQRIDDQISKRILTETLSPASAPLIAGEQAIAALTSVAVTMRIETRCIRKVTLEGIAERYHN